ncbi:hypothetical protein ACXYMT_11055 [Salinimicrobium sp. CAU 1759]
MTSQNSLLEKARDLYGEAAEKEEAARELLALTEKKSANEPVILGYKAAGHMMMAKHVGNPFKKMSHFNKGKSYLTTAIEADKQNLELRFLRFAVQAEAPGFLGFRQNLQEDKTLLLGGVRSIKDPHLQSMILNYLRTSKGLTSAEKERLE